MTWAMPRYRLPVDAVALVFAALALSRLLEWVTSVATRQASPAGAAD
jgi:hypothetical protein